MFRPSFLNKVYESLTTGCFSTHEFTIVESEKEDDTILKISFIYQPDYFIEIRFSPTKRSYSSNAFSISYSPGDFITLQTATFNEMNTLHGYICKWVENIQDDMLSTVAFRLINEKISAQDKIIMQIDEKIEAMDDHLFTQAEQNDIKDKLEMLEKEVTDKLNDLGTENKELRKDLENMKQEIELLKTTLGQLQNKNWLKMFAIKFLNWSAKPQNQQLISAGIEVAKQALPNDIKNIINAE